MIAKIITHGPTRAVALSQLRQALARTEVAGSVTNLAFLGALARHPGFGAGDVDTGLIERDLDALVAEVPASTAVLALAALAAADLPEAPLTGFALWSPLRRSIGLIHQDEPLLATLALTGPDTAEVTLGDAVLHARRQGGAWYIAQAAAIPVIRAGGAIHVFAPEATFSFRPLDPLARDAGAAGAGNATLSPMPGLVKAVFVAPGQAVAAGDRLCVLEAMKMEHTLTAARDGVVEQVLTEAGQQVEAGAALILLAEQAE
jgi:3-methylcrotonyl-CoA carboxylase alpha subunit